MGGGPGLVADGIWAAGCDSLDLMASCQYGLQTCLRQDAHHVVWKLLLAVMQYTSRAPPGNDKSARRTRNAGNADNAMSLLTLPAVCTDMRCM